MIYEALRDAFPITVKAVARFHRVRRHNLTLKHLERAYHAALRGEDKLAIISLINDIDLRYFIRERQP